MKDVGEGVPTTATASVSWRNLAFLSSVANMGSLLCGFDYGATSWLLTRIAQYGVDTGSGFDDEQFRVFVSVARNPLWMGFIGAGSSIGATAAFLFLLSFGNGIPKNDEIMLSALMYFTGALLESSAGAVSWHNNIGLCLLLVGRLLYGTGIALSFHSVPQYISEISPRVGRGSIGSLTEAMTVTGVVLGFLVGYLDSKGSGFVVTFRVGYLIAVVMGMLAMVLPRSPLWLARKGADDEEILESLQFIRPAASLESVADVRKTTATNDSDKLRWEGKLRKMEQQQLQGGGGGGCVACCAASAKAPQTKLLVLHRALRRSLALAMSLALLSQLGGQGALVYYAGTVFDQVCPAYTNDCIVGFGMVKLFAVCIMLFVTDLRGRRFFVVGGTATASAGLVALCVGLASGLHTVALVGIYVSGAASEVGLSLLWVVVGELFPQFVRFAAVSLAVATYFASASLVAFVFPLLVRLYGLYGVCAGYAAACVVALVAAIFLLPETRGSDSEVAFTLVGRRVDACCGGGGGDGGGDEANLPLKESENDLGCLDGTGAARSNADGDSGYA